MLLSVGSVVLWVEFFIPKEEDRFYRIFFFINKDRKEEWKVLDL